MDKGERYVLSTDVEVLENGDQCVLVNPGSLEWIKLTRDAYLCVENRQGLTLSEAVTAESERSGGGPREIEALFAYLAKAGFIVSSREAAGLARAYLNVTSRCNLSCPTCYFSAGGERDRAGHELGADEIEGVLDALAEARLQSLVVAGGEPFLRGDTCDIIGLARGRFDEIVVLTNGTLIDDARANKIARAGAKVQVSLESDSAAVHDAARGPGSFVAAIRGIRALLDAGARCVEIVPTLTRKNLASVPGIIELAESLGVGYHFSLFMAVGRGACHVRDLAIPPAELLACVAAMLRAPHAVGQAEPATARPHPPVELCARRGCGAGTDLISIAPDGLVYPCPLMHRADMVLGRLPQDPLWDLRRRARRLVPGVGAMPACLDCDVAYFCGGGCRGHALAQSGDVFSRDPYCEFYRTLYGVLLWEWREDRSPDENLRAVLAGLGAGA